MPAFRLSLPVVCLYRRGIYVRAVERPFSPRAAAAYAESYNRLGGPAGYTAQVKLFAAQTDFPNSRAEGEREASAS